MRQVRGEDAGLAGCQLSAPQVEEVNSVPASEVGFELLGVPPQEVAEPSEFPPIASMMTFRKSSNGAIGTRPSSVRCESFQRFH